jgi:hypothetical protein
VEMRVCALIPVVALIIEPREIPFGQKRPEIYWDFLLVLPILLTGHES